MALLSKLESVLIVPGPDKLDRRIFRPKTHTKYMYIWFREGDLLVTSFQLVCYMQVSLLGMDHFFTSLVHCPVELCGLKGAGGFLIF